MNSDSKTWNPEVETFRKELMKLFSNRCSMEAIAEAAYQLAGCDEAGYAAPATPDPFSKGYKHRHGEPVSDACGDGKHAECTQDLTKCHCTYRSGHTTMHAYMNSSKIMHLTQHQNGNENDKQP
jgi:hypothetical protein